MGKLTSKYTRQNIGNTELYLKSTEYQRDIIRDMVIDKATIQSSEGSNYKAWMSYPDGTTRKVRVDSVNTICERGGNEYFIFGESTGIRLR